MRISRISWLVKMKSTPIFKTCLQPFSTDYHLQPKTLSYFFWYLLCFFFKTISILFNQMKFHVSILFFFTDDKGEKHNDFDIFISHNRSQTSFYNSQHATIIMWNLTKLWNIVITMWKSRLFKIILVSYSEGAYKPHYEKIKKFFEEYKTQASLQT